VTQIGPSSAADSISGPIKSITSNRSAAGILLVVGLATSLWSASAYVGAFTRASNVAWETPEGRSFFKLRPLQILVTLVMVVTLVIVALALVMTGPVVEAVGDSIGVGGTALQVWDIVKWPVLVAMMVLIVSLLYYAGPNVKVPGFKWITPGSALAVLVWIIASGLFALYVANFGSYDKTYGTLGGAVTLLVWMWITNLALLFGVELNAERERGRELAAGVPRADREIQLEPRDEPKGKRTT
jgi:membrane protein